MSFLNSIFKKSNHYLFFANFYKEWLGGDYFEILAKIKAMNWQIIAFCCQVIFVFLCCLIHTEMLHLVFRKGC